MSILTTLAYYRTAVFYYLLGGVTFVPLCALGLVVYFWLFAPLANSGGHRADATGNQSLAEALGTEGEFSEERKRKALDLATWNRDAQTEEQLRKARENEGESATAKAAVPVAARRMKPPPPQPRRPHRAGWLTVRRHFVSDGVNMALHQAAAAHQQATSRQANASPSGNGAANSPVGAASDAKGQGYMSSLYRGMLSYRNKNAPPGERKHNLPESGRSTPEQALEDAAAALTTSQPSASASSSASAQQSATKETFYCILKGPILYLYSNADPSNPDTEVHAAIDLRNKRVSIFVSGVGDTMGEPDESTASSASSAEATLDTSTDSPAMSEAEATDGKDTSRRRANVKKARVRDGELFVKRNAIRIVSMGKTTGRAVSKDSGIRFAQWFIFAKSATQLEDWYHSILSASRLPDGPSGEGPDLVGPVFSPEDMANLLVSLDSVPDPIPLRWLNAMVGRIFFSIYKTAWLEDYIKAKFRKKMSRVRTPGFLSDIRIRDVDLGSTPPAFSRPMLKSLTGEGEASMEVELHYTGALRLTISTVLTISLGSRFKQYNVSLVLAVIVNSLEGNLLLHIKPPPSNRIWFGFTKLPKIDISVEPVVSERKVQWSMVKRLIEGRIRELLTESLVLPNMDDIPFFDTRDLDHRGGIWADAGKHAKKVDLESTMEAQQDQTGPPTAEPDTVGPQSKSTPASVLNVPMGQDDEGASASIDGGAVGNQLRNRRPLAGGDDEMTSNSEPALLAPSPAVAGLSSLLARDQAAASTSTSSASSSKTISVSGPSSQRRRTSWFVGGKSNGSRTPSGVKSTSGVRRSGQPQSSLAWGNASLERPGEAGAGGESLSAAAAMAAHERNKESITSLSSVGTSSYTDEAADDVGVDGLDDAHADADADGEKTIDGSAIDQAHQAEDDGVVDVPQSRSVGNAGSVVAEDELLVAAETLHAAVNDDASTARENTLAPPPSVPPRPIAKSPSPTGNFAPPPQRSVPRSPTSSYAASTHSTSAAVESQQQQQQRGGSLAAQSLATLQRERYGVPANPDDNAARAALTSAALLSTWNKAKASVADRDSRQAAAKEAKDAIKRGWSSWKASRSAVPQGSLQRDDVQNSRMDSIMTSSDRLGEVSSMEGANVVGNWRAQQLHQQQQQQQREARSRTNSWLASSPEDPVSLGAGFDVLSSSPANVSIATAAGATAETATSAGDNLKDDQGTRVSSRASSISGGRKPYHEHRADRLTRSKAADHSSRPSSRASSVNRSLSRPSTPPPLPSPMVSQEESAAGAGGGWDAAPLGLSTPLPAAQRDESRSTAHQQSALSTSPSTIRRTLNTSAAGLSPSTSQSALGASSSEGSARPSYSFMPGQPTATIGLSDVVLPTFPKRQQETTAESNVKPQEAVAMTVPTDATKPAERRTSAATATSDTAVQPTVQAPTPPKGIKQQPMRAAMMAVPGIPSMQKAGPQSFEAPAPTPPPPSSSSTKTAGETLNAASSPRLGIGNLIARIPSFSSVSGAQAASAPAAAPATEASLSAHLAKPPAVTASSTDTEGPFLQTLSKGEVLGAPSGFTEQPAMSQHLSSTADDRPDAVAAPTNVSTEPAGALELTMPNANHAQNAVQEETEAVADAAAAGKPFEQNSEVRAFEHSSTLSASVPQSNDESRAADPTHD